MAAWSTRWWRSAAQGARAPLVADDVRMSLAGKRLKKVFFNVLKKVKKGQKSKNKEKQFKNR